MLLLIEDGVDIISLRDLLGHQYIQTTLEYLHIAQLERQATHSPLDTLYGWKMCKATYPPPLP